MKQQNWITYRVNQMTKQQYKNKYKFYQRTIRSQSKQQCIVSVTTVYNILYFLNQNVLPIDFILSNYSFIHFICQRQTNHNTKTTQMKYFYPSNPSNNSTLIDFNSVMNANMKNSPVNSNQKNYKNNEQKTLKNGGFGLEPIQELAYPAYIEGNHKKKEMNSPKTALTYQKKQQLKSKLSLKNELDLMHAPNDKKFNKINMAKNTASPKALKKTQPKLNPNFPSFQYENVYYPKKFRQEMQYNYPEEQIPSQRFMKKSFISSPTSDTDKTNIFSKNLPVFHTPQCYPVAKKSMILPHTQNINTFKNDHRYLQKQSFINPQQQYIKNKNMYDEAMSAQSQSRNVSDIIFPMKRHQPSRAHFGSANNLHFYSSSQLAMQDYRNQHRNHFISRQNAMIHPDRHDKMKTSMIQQPTTHFQTSKHSNSLSLQKDNNYQCKIPHYNSFSNLPDFLSNKHQDKVSENAYPEVNSPKNRINQKSNNSSYQKLQYNSQKDLFKNVSNNSPKMINNKIEMKHFQGHKLNTFSHFNDFVAKKKEQIAIKNHLHQAQLQARDNAHQKKSLKNKKSPNRIAQKKKALALLKQQYSQSRKNSPSINISNSPPSSNDNIYSSQIQEFSCTESSNRKPRKNSYQWKSNMVPKVKQHKQSWENQRHSGENLAQNDFYCNENIQFSFAKKPNKAANGIPIETAQLWQKKKSIRFSEPPSIVIGYQFNHNKNQKQTGKTNTLPDAKFNKQIKFLNESVDTKQSSNYYRAPKIYDFQVGKQLGRGKFGVVNMALHKKTGLLFALKTLSKKSIKKEKVYDQIIREVKIQYFMNHPHLVKLYGIFDDRENIYLLLQYCTDGQLYQILQHRNKFSEVDACIIMKQLCQGIAELHRNNVIHRDMKPQNVVVNFGMCKICDFGWSIYSQNKQSLRQTLCGTPLYFSPQLITQGSYNEKVDLWALGMMAYELMNGDIPFDIKSQDELIKIATSDIVYPPSMSLEVIQFIKLLLQRNPQRRVDIDKVLKHKFFDTYHKQTQSARSRSAAKLMNHK